MTDLVTRLRAADISGHGSYSALVREAADEIERLEARCAQTDRYIALLNGEIIDNGKLRDEIERLRGELEGKISQSYAAELARQVGELEAENELLREALREGKISPNTARAALNMHQLDKPRDDGTHVHRLDEREGDQ